ncbi:MAG: uroporphyrinogen decarboxylase family protein [Chloroflexota bacterium]|nr:uroporphyrinogen decarboxylase family protein [Chloroflexota bacterium]
MNKRERLEHAVAGEPTDRPPVTLWRHFPGDDQRAADLARSIIEFQRAYDWDLLTIMPSSHFSVIDHGIQDSWDGSLDGVRSTTRPAIERSLDWTTLRPLDPLRGALGKQVECVNLVCEAFGETVPTLQVLFSPLLQAEMLAGKETLVAHLRTQPDRLHTALTVLTDTTLRFIDALRRLPLAGIALVIPHASAARLSEDEYRMFGFAYDRKIMESLPTRWWFNSVHLPGDLPMLKCASELRAHAVAWRDRDTEPDLTNAKLMLGGALCGGVSPTTHLHTGTPSTVRDAVRDALQQTNYRRLIISSGAAARITTPLSNLRALREAVESA